MLKLKVKTSQEDFQQPVEPIETDDSEVNYEAKEEDELEELPIGVTKFENLKITTMVCVFHLNGTLDIKTLFYFLPVTRIDLPQRVRQTKKYKIPYCGIPGAITSIRYEGNVRGIVRSSTGTYFGHSLSIDIATSVKNIAVKLAPESVHMCGASSNETAWECIHL